MSDWALATHTRTHNWEHLASQPLDPLHFTHASSVSVCAGLAYQLLILYIPGYIPIAHEL